MRSPIRSALAAGAAGLLACVAAACAAAPAAIATPAAATPAASAAPVQPPTSTYEAFVLAESADQVSLVRFGPTGMTVERQTRVGLLPTEINGPHGVSVSPDGRYYYVSIAHGMPNGTLWKLTTAGDTVKARVPLGLFPASVSVTPDGAYAYVVNFNLHGDMVPSSVSVVATDEMAEVARIQTCTMPHGSRITRDGARHYSTCMMDDLLIEIDTRTFAVARHFMVSKELEHGEAGPPRAMHHDAMSGQPHHVAERSVSCSPTWALPAPDGASVFVACNKANDIVEVDAARWELRRRIPAGDGVYNLALSPDGRLLVGTNKRGQSISVIDVASGRELARIATKRRVPHGVVITADGRYALVTEEGVGSEPGTVEAFDLRALRAVASAEVGQQAAGIDLRP